MIVDSREVWLKDGEKLVLRSLTEADAGSLLELAKVVSAQSYRNLNRGPEAWAKITLEKQTEVLKSMAVGERSCFIGAFTVEGQLVGNISAAPPSQGEFARFNLAIGMGVLEEFQGRSLGTQLIRTLMFEAKAAGVHRLELSVRTYNTSGIALYEKCGFERIGTAHHTAFIDGRFVDEFLYELILK